MAAHVQPECSPLVESNGTSISKCNRGNALWVILTGKRLGGGAMGGWFRGRDRAVSGPLSRLLGFKKRQRSERLGEW